MNVKRGLVGLLILCGVGWGAASSATAVEVLQPVRLYPDAAPGVAGTGCPEAMIGQPPDRVIYNVTVPTYQPYLPPKARSTGTAVIVAPGGGFELLAIDNEGIEVAKWLAERGIAAFVLKYRVAQTDPNNPPKVGLARQPPQVAPAPCAASLPAAGSIDIVTRGAPGIADGIATIQQIREHAEQYHIDPKRIVMMGFSAGAMVTAGSVLQQDAAARPDFAAPIYGGPFGSMPVIPSGLPPLFLAVAQNDRLVGAPVKAFYEALLAAGYHPELHVFNGGSHGFGMHTLGTTSDHWKDSFFWWLESLGLTQKPGDPPRPPTPAFARPLTP
jgi:acetyl esterase/lipase